MFIHIFYKSNVHRKQKAKCDLCLYHLSQKYNPSWYDHQKPTLECKLPNLLALIFSGPCLIP